MTIKEMNAVIQKHCVRIPKDDCKFCIIHDLCELVSGDFESDEIVCTQAYEVVKPSFPVDAVNHPSHYNQGKYECIDVMVETFGKEATMDFCLLNAFKYIWRTGEKNGAEDVKKADWYLHKYLELEGEKDEDLSEQN